MEPIVCVACIDQKELDGIVEVFRRNLDYSLKIIVVGTGEELEDPFVDGLDITIKQLENKPRLYAVVMYEKVLAVEPYCNDNSLVFMLDPDYSLNPFAISFAEKIFSENPFVSYMSLLRGPGIFHAPIEKLSGFPFFLHPSTMGGAVIARWSTFCPDAQQFFREYAVTSDSPGKADTWDVEYWNWLWSRTRKRDHVWTIAEPMPSLMQHNNLGSKYKREGHMYAVNFDNRTNPEEWIKNNA